MIKYAGISDRVAYILVKLTRNKTLKIIQVYAPTETYSDELVDEFYEQIPESPDKDRCRLTMIIEDLNANVGSRQDEREIAIGEHGFGTRNERGQMLVNFLVSNKLYAMSTFFKKNPKQKWTWRSSDFKYKNEIDFIISNNPHIIDDVAVINTVKTGSDHRLLRAKLTINLELSKNVTKRLKVIRIDHEELVQNILHYQIELGENLKQTKYNTVNEAATHTAVRECAERVSPNKEIISKKISDNTKALLQRRRDLKPSKDENLIEWAELNKLLRRNAERCSQI